MQVVRCSEEVISIILDKKTPDNRRDGVQVIARAADLLRALQGEPDGLSLRQLAERLGLPRSTVHRIAVALEKEEFVAEATTNGRLRLGPGLHRLAAASLRDISQPLRTYLKKLSDILNETVDLAVLEQGRVFFVDQIPVRQRLQAVSAVGTYFPAYCTANGKALLAQLPMEEVDGILPEHLTPFTLNTIVSREELAAQLESIRLAQVAVDREEHTLGICGVGCAIRDAMGRLAAISVPMPAQRFYGNEARVIQELLRIRQEIMRDLGVR